ncbi:hypothetical protein QR685DRAFT_526438 [Neurospora intermedia]|uniref:Secreted protein n=1 Tax=Neurospora intermedia TaxID=5142 RepID=A0ABR3DA32_NEUIN
MACQCHWGCHSLFSAAVTYLLLLSPKQKQQSAPKHHHSNLGLSIQIHPIFHCTYLLALHLSLTSLDTILRSRSFFLSLAVSQFVAPRETSTLFSWSLIGVKKYFHLLFPSSILRLQRSLT